MNRLFHKLGRAWRVWRKEVLPGVLWRLRRRSYAALLPVYNSNPRWLRACLDSVGRQVYPHWELCIADDRPRPDRDNRKSECSWNGLMP